MTPDTFNPDAHIAELEAELSNITALWEVAHNERSAGMMRVAELEAENSLLRVDAARYRYLRGQKLDDPTIYIGVDSIDFPKRWALGAGDELKVDAAIDAAMKQNDTRMTPEQIDAIREKFGREAKGAT